MSCNTIMFFVALSLKLLYIFYSFLLYYKVINSFSIFKLFPHIYFNLLYYIILDYYYNCIQSLLKTNALLFYNNYLQIMFASNELVLETHTISHITRQCVLKGIAMCIHPTNQP